MTRQEARNLVRELFLKTLPHLAVRPRMKQMVRLGDGVLAIAGDRVALHTDRAVRVIALGKAAIEMTHTLAEILRGVRLRGLAAAPSLPPHPLPGFEYFAGGHPYPNEQSRRAAEAALALLDDRSARADDVVIFLISGGGSSLFETPADRRVPTEDLRRFYELLVTCGARITEINTVRKHFSAVKGGWLACAASPATQVTLYVSDVPEHLPEMVASGPTMPDATSLADCSNVIREYGLLKAMPLSYREMWQSARAPETPSSGDPCFTRSLYHCLLSNRNATDQLRQRAEEHGVIVELDNRCDDWNFAKASDYLLARLAELRLENAGKPVAVISGGELSCPVTGDGLGGRNQAFVLDCVPKIAGQPIVVLSGGTDGIDGNSPATGAIADGGTLARALALGLDPESYQQRSDSFTFFDQLGDTIVTGPTGTNVRDLRLLLAYESEPRA